MILALSSHADFEPDDAPKGFVEWTFLVPQSQAFGAGVYELRFERLFNEAERNGDFSAIAEGQ